jgi:hypothetical protein
MATTTPSSNERRSGSPRVTKVESLATLVGAHPDALRDLYAAGDPTDATALGGLRRGLLLTVEPLEGAFVLTRPLVRAFSRLGLFAGKTFESGGTAGQDRFAGGDRFRFRCELGPSLLDGKPTLVMRYDELGNPWPISACVDELRTIGNVGIGLTALSPGRHARVAFWWGLEL